MKFNERGEELPDPTPVEIPAGFKEPESIQSMIARLVRTHVSDAAARHGFETVDEANDFEVEDEEFGETKYEVLGDERLDEAHRSAVDARAAARAIARAKARAERTRRNAGHQGQAESTERAGSQHQSPGPDRDDGRQRGSSGDGHLAGSQSTKGGSA